MNSYVSRDPFLFLPYIGPINGCNSQSCADNEMRSRFAKTRRFDCHNCVQSESFLSFRSFDSFQEQDRHSVKYVGAVSGRSSDKCKFTLKGSCTFMIHTSAPLLIQQVSFMPFKVKHFV